MAWWTVAAVAAQVAGSVYSRYSAKSQNADQREVNLYNAQSRYNTSMNNIRSSVALAKLNAKLAAEVGAVRSKVIRETSRHNADMILATTAYNDSLLENELELLWEASELDLTQLHNQRSRERGTMVATQASSGTVISEGSNADVVSDQMAQEAMDALIISRGADIRAASINNQRAQSLWKGTSEAMSVAWEGEMNAYVSDYNTQAAISGALAGAQISANADTISANNQFVSDLYGASSAYSQNSEVINNNFMSGMFGAASTAAQMYGSTKTASSSYTPAGSGSSANTVGGSSGSSGSLLIDNSSMNWGGR